MAREPVLIPTEGPKLYDRSHNYFRRFLVLPDGVHEDEGISKRFDWTAAAANQIEQRPQLAVSS